MEWGEAVEGLAMAVVDNRIHADCADVRRTGEFLTHRILSTLQKEMKMEKRVRTIVEQLLFSENFDIIVSLEFKAMLT